MQSFPLKFTDRFERSKATSKRYCFWLKNRPYVSQREYYHAVWPFSW